MPISKDFLLLDCTLRDGGYYTNWDFPDTIIKDYLEAMNKLPIDYVELGYRSNKNSGYAGAFFYLPQSLINICRDICTKKLAIILNEKAVSVDEVKKLLEPCKNVISMVRLAVAPENTYRAIGLARKVRELGFEVGFNVMYASKWEDEFYTKNVIKELNSVANYFYIVDSYGGLFPEDVEQIISKLKQSLTIPIGFHGHNNLEMALINSLTALQAGATIIDATVSGMGRGAGNCKTELLLTLLNKKKDLEVDFDVLHEVTQSFLELHDIYKWGTNLPYMVSGAFSVPQNEVINKVNKRFFSLTSMVNEVSRNNNPESQQELKEFKPAEVAKTALIIGGGKTPGKYAEVLLEFLKENSDILLIFSSSKNVAVFSGLSNMQIHCLSGREGKRLEKNLEKASLQQRKFVTPPSEVSKNNYIIPGTFDNVFQVKSFTKVSEVKESSTALAVEIALRFSPEQIFLAGYDGYEESVTQQELELFQENQRIFDILRSENIAPVSLTPTRYAVATTSIYSLI